MNDEVIWGPPREPTKGMNPHQRSHGNYVTFCTIVEGFVLKGLPDLRVCWMA